MALPLGIVVELPSFVSIIRLCISNLSISDDIVVALFFVDECFAAAAAGERRFMCIPCTGKSESRQRWSRGVVVVVVWLLFVASRGFSGVLG